MTLLNRANALYLGGKKVDRVYAGTSLIWPNWQPSILYENGEQGGWYDPSDRSTLFQDTAGSVPVTADGQPVALMLDKSGRGNHLVQAALASRPIYRTDGVLCWLDFDGSDDFMWVPSVSLIASDKVFISSGFMANPGTGMVVELSVNTNTNAGSFYHYNNNGSFEAICRGNAGITAANISRLKAPALAVVSAVHSIDNPKRSQVRVNGTIGPETTANRGTGNFGAYPLFVGRRGGTALPFNGKIYGLIVRGTLTADADIIAADKWIAKKSGAVL